MENAIIISRSDIARLRATLSAPAMHGALDRDDLVDLFDELDRATIVEAEHLPADVVALGSSACVRDVVSGEEGCYTLVLPQDADISLRRISVIAPLGTALLGARVGDVVEWQMPGGLRRIRIDAVVHGTSDGSDQDGPARTRRAA